MKTAIIALSIALSLSGCAKFNKAWDAVTSAKVPPKVIVVAVNAFDAAKVTAKNYIVYCTPNPAPKGCDDKVIKTKLIPTINKGTQVRNELEQFMEDHPGELGARGAYDILISTTNVITTIVGEK